jgi:hypothetical protein
MTNYKEFLKTFNRNSLKPTNMEESITKIIADGNALLESEHPKTPVADDKKKLESKLSQTSTNVYIRARGEVLASLPDWKRKEIERMESEHNLDNEYYNDFVRKVAALGDKLSS